MLSAEKTDRFLDMNFAFTMGHGVLEVFRVRKSNLEVAQEVEAGYWIT